MRTFSSLLFTLAILPLTTGSAFAADLFNGRDFSGWELVTPTATDIDSVMKMLPDAVIASTGKPVGFIATTRSYENFRLHAEWRWSGKPGNGGVLIHISEGPKDGPWPLSQQIQTKNKNVGDLLPMAGASFAEPLTTAPGAKPPIKARTEADSEKPVGEWNTCDVVSQDGTIEVTVNGVLQNKVTQSKPHAGRVGFQLENTPYELRNVSITELK